jgi:hypothetical protein
MCSARGWVHDFDTMVFILRYKKLIWVLSFFSSVEFWGYVYDSHRMSMPRPMLMLLRALFMSFFLLQWE